MKPIYIVAILAGAIILFSVSNSEANTGGGGGGYTPGGGGGGGGGVPTDPRENEIYHVLLECNNDGISSRDHSRTWRAGGRANGEKWRGPDATQNFMIAWNAFASRGFTMPTLNNTVQYTDKETGFKSISPYVSKAISLVSGMFII